MTNLSQARQELAAALEATGWSSVPYVPEQIEPPVVIAQPSEDYVSPDSTTFDTSEVRVSVDLFLLADYHSNQQAADLLDEMLTKVLPAVYAAGWDIGGAGAPGPYNTADWLAHGVRLTVNRFVTL